MYRSRAALAIVLGVSLAPARPADADTTQLGAWFGPRVYSGSSSLGYLEDAPFHPELDNAISLGFRVARPFLPWLVPELELAIAPGQTKPIGGAPATDVFWMDPRLHLRFELLPGKRIQPFAVVGAGSPVLLSSARQTIGSGVTAAVYGGGGVRLDTTKGFTIRLDARMVAVPAVEKTLTSELEFGLGVEFTVGKTTTRARKAVVKIADADGDGIADADDKCPDRPEDFDGFEDADGCPDIDNDGDRVLDIADKCPMLPETYNGFEDQDGCPDILPPEVDALRGTVEGLIYSEGETLVRDSAQASIGKIRDLMVKHPSIRVVLIGHTDSEEAKQFATAAEPGQPPPDVAALSADLSRARAEAVKLALITTGIVAGRVDIEGRGADEPVADNDRPRGRLANRRVEIKLYVPPSAR